MSTPPLLSLSDTLLLRILSFVDQPMRGICKRLDAIEQKKELEQKRAEWVRENYFIRTNVSNDPLWLLLANERVAVLLGETHHFRPNMETNSKLAGALRGPKVYLTEQKPPANNQLICNDAEQFCWENPHQRQILDNILSPLFQSKLTLIRRYQAMKDASVQSYFSEARIFSRVLSHEYKEFSPLLDLLNDWGKAKVNEHHEEITKGCRRLLTAVVNQLSSKINCVLDAVDSPRELSLARKCAISLQKVEVRPIVVAGRAHVHTDGENRTLSYLNQLGVSYLALVPKQVGLESLLANLL